MKNKWFYSISILIFMMNVMGCNPVGHTAVPSVSVPSVTTTSTIPFVPETNAGDLAIPAITDISWDDEGHFLMIQVDPWLSNWPDVVLWVDGSEFPVKEEEGAVVYRPNAPLEQPPDGIIVGTLPWVTGLDEVDFPCCGTVQLAIAGVGSTNSYEFNFRDFGCTTASAIICPSEWTVHEGDIEISGTDSMTIEDSKYLQKGNIYVNDSATLTIRNSELMIERGSTPTIHVYIFVEPNAKLIIENSKVYPGLDNGGLTCVINHGSTTIIDSPTSIHYLDMSDGAILTMQNSSMIYEIGGLLQVTGGSTNVIDSTIGALGIEVPAEAHLNISGLKSGTHFDEWKIQDMVPEADYALNFKNVTILEDDFTGMYEHGPYERGWIFFLDPDSHVRLSDSELRKIFLEVRNEEVEFRDLQIGIPSSLNYRDIILEDVIVEGEWPFTIMDANVKIINSNYLFLQPSGNSTIHLVNSHIVEFIPRDFTGTMVFENSTWTTAGEILGDVDYHSSSNNFTIQGGLTFDESLRTNLQWKNARVTREFEVILTDTQGSAIDQGMIKVLGKEYSADKNGTIKFSVLFTEENYDTPLNMEVWSAGNLIDQQGIDFFTGTPIRIQVK